MSRTQFRDLYTGYQRDIKITTAEIERDNRRKQIQIDNYEDDYDEEDDDCPGLEELEGNSPRKSPRKNNINFTKSLEESKQNEKQNILSQPKNQELSDQSSPEKERRREETRKQIEQFNDDYLDDPSQNNFPVILNYLPKPKDKSFLDLSRTKQMTEEEQRQKAEEETKLVEQYLNKLFPETIQKEMEISDEQAIRKQIDTNIETKNQLPKKIASLDNDIWKEPALKKELKEQYKKQAFYLDKINMLFQDKLILKSNLREKEKKILEIQRVLRDLNDYKVSYLNLHDVEKIDQIIINSQQMNQKEITELRNRINELEKDSGLYKQKYEIFRDKYELVMKEASEAKYLIQEQIKDLLNCKRYYLKKEEESKKEKEERNKEPNDRLSKIKKQQQKISQNNTINQSQAGAGGGQNSVDEASQNQFQSSQNITIPSFIQNQQEKNGFAQHPEGRRSSFTGQFDINTSQIQQQQKQNQQYMSFQRNSPPNTPPTITYQIPPSPILTSSNNQYPSSDQLSQNGNNSNKYNQTSQQQKNRSGLTNLDLENNDQANQLISADKQAQLLIGLTTSQEQIKSPRITSTNQESKPINQSDSKKMKKPQVKFEDEKQIAAKTKEQEEDDYYNQLCASKIKNMVKAIQLSHSHLIEESTYYQRK